MRKSWWLGLMSVLMLTCVSAGEALAFDPMADLEASFRARSSLDSRIREYLLREEEGRFTDNADWAVLRSFYESREFQSVWLKNAPAKQAVPGVVARLATASVDGLPDRDLSPYEQQLRNGTSDDRQQAMFDVMLTEAVMLYAKGLVAGQFDPGQIDKEWHIKPPTFDAPAFLKQVAASEDPLKLLADLEPKSAGYVGLKKALARYRTIAERGGWAPLPANLPSLKPGMSAPSVPLLRKRLLAEFDYNSAEPASSTRYDEGLAQVMREFQRRNGLRPDGVVGPGTRVLLNMPLSERLRSIQASLERWRWMPRELGSRYVMVNLPAFQLDLVDQGTVVWQTKVIAGRKERQSPALSSNISQLRVNPKWHVPDSLAIKDMVPHQLEDPNYLRKSGYRIFVRGSDQEVDPRSIDWASYKEASNFPYLIRQEAGDQNALGRLKFEMPNKYAIYLHDTPAKNLFDKDERMYSSGCIRVDSPYELAGKLLDLNAADEASRKVVAAIDQGETQVIPLPEKVPVYITYFTAWTDDAGGVHFRRDVYDRNQLFSSVSAKTEQADL